MELVIPHVKESLQIKIPKAMVFVVGFSGNLQYSKMRIHVLPPADRYPHWTGRLLFLHELGCPAKLDSLLLGFVIP